MGPAPTPALPLRGRGASPPLRPDVDADRDADGVALAAVTTAGVLLGARFPLAAAWFVATLCLMAASLGVGLGGHRVRPGTGPYGDGRFGDDWSGADGSGAGRSGDDRPRAGRSGGDWSDDDRSGDNGSRDDRSSASGRAHGGGSGAGVSAAGGGGVRPRDRVLAGVLVLGTLLAAGAAAASVRVVTVQHGVLARRAGQPGRVEVTGAVVEEPRRVRYGGYWVVLAVDRVRVGEQTHRTRERAGLFLGRSQWEALARDPGPEGQREVLGRGSGPEGQEEALRQIPGVRGKALGRDRGARGEASGRGLGEGGRLAVGERLRVRASVAAARWSDPLGRQPRVVLRRPVIEGRAPPRDTVAGAVLRASEVVRDAARRRALATLAPERAGLLVGMALGDTSLLSGDLERDFRAAGLTHLMAVSGANLAVVLGAGLWLAGGAGAGRQALAAFGAMLVVLLVVVTRWEPSVLRAGVMAGLVLAGMATGRGPGGRRALCLAVIVLLLTDPALVGALGFQLSVAATAGVLWLGPATARALPDRVPERVRTAVGMTLGAQATALPALALVFGRLSLAGLPANLLGLPLAGAPMLLGVVAAATAPLAPWAAALACRLADPFLMALIAVARWAAGLPGGSVTLTGPARAGPAVAVVLVLLVVARRRRSPYLAGPGRVDPPPDPERTVRGRDDHRRRAPPGGAVPP